MAGIDGYTSSMLSCPLTSEFGGSIFETDEQHDAFGALAGAGTPLSIDARWLVQTPEPGGAAGVPVGTCPNQPYPLPNPNPNPPQTLCFSTVGAHIATPSAKSRRLKIA